MRLYPGDFLLFPKIDSVLRDSNTCATYDYWINFILNNPIRRVGGGGRWRVGNTPLANLNPSNAQATFVKSTRMQTIAKTFQTLSCGCSLDSSH